jgi:hypothetical protein
MGGAGPAARAAPAAITPAAGVAKPKGKAVVSGTPTECSYEVTTQIPDGQTEALPNETLGKQWGSTYCSGLGWGVRKNLFTTSSDTGTIQGTFGSYFADGSVHGKFTMVPQEGSLSLSFATSSFAGRIKVLGGSGAWKGYTGHGKTSCTSSDGLHFFCDDKLVLIKR